MQGVDHPLARKDGDRWVTALATLPLEEGSGAEVCAIWPCRRPWEGSSSQQEPFFWGEGGGRRQRTRCMCDIWRFPG